MSEIVAGVHDLHHTYLPGTPVSTLALRGADMTVSRGEIHGLVGESGAGKSTLVQFLNGLLRPMEAGRVVVYGRDMHRRDPEGQQQETRVGLVFQYPHHQLFERYVGDDVAYGPRQLGLKGTALRDRVRWAMEAVGLDFEAFVDRHTFSLSGGEMRRTALAGVVAMQPKLLILDKATTGLDPRGRRDVHRLLRWLRREEATTVVLVSNDMGEVAELTDRVTVLRNGRTVASGPTREILALDDLSRLGIAAPPAARLARTLRQRGVPVPHEAITVDEVEEGIWTAIAP